VKIVVADCATGPQLAIAGRSSGHVVLIVTAEDTEASIVRAVEAGVRGYLLLTSPVEAIAGAVRSLADGGSALDPIVAARMLDSLAFNALTNRETEVLRLVMLGLGDKAIANRLGRALGTVKSHVKALLVKLDARSRTEAVAIAQRRGFISAEPTQPMRAARRRAPRDYAPARRPRQLAGTSVARAQ
jgi:DNA-binding NarL/FixJ family response regulator